jgi:UDP-GlcNAc3NAcA epimerase
VVVHTGQHYDHEMSEILFSETWVAKPDYQLGVGSGIHGAQTEEMLKQIEHVLLKERPDWVLVYGDTNSTLAGAIAATKLHISTAHVEAGLRSFNRRMPEEINRVIADSVSDLLFAPTEVAANNLRREGISNDKARVVGDVMYDAALFFSNQVDSERVLSWLRVEKGGYILVTLHRAENTDDQRRMVQIVALLKAAAELAPLLLPLHPRTRKVLHEMGLLD